MINALKTFPSTAKWQSLVPNAIAVNEPENPTFKKPRAPTVPVGDAQFIQKKYEFNEIFDIQSFAGKRDSYEQGLQGKNKINPKTKRPIKYSVTRTKGCVNEKFNKKHGLSSKSISWDLWMPSLHSRRTHMFEKVTTFCLKRLKDERTTKQYCPAQGSPHTLITSHSNQEIQGNTSVFTF